MTSRNKVVNNKLAFQTNFMEPQEQVQIKGKIIKKKRALSEGSALSNKSNSKIKFDNEDLTSEKNIERSFITCDEAGYNTPEDEVSIELTEGEADNWFPINEEKNLENEFKLVEEEYLNDNIKINDLKKPDKINPNESKKVESKMEENKQSINSIFEDNLGSKLTASQTEGSTLESHIKRTILPFNSINSIDRKSTRLNYSHSSLSRMQSSA